MNRRQKIIVSVTGIFLVLLILVGLTYAFFVTRIRGNNNPTSISVTTADLRLVYEDDTNEVIGGEKLEPSNTVYTKQFTVTNEGNTNINYGVYLIDVINTFERKDDIKYTLECSTTGTIECSGKESTTFPSGISELVTNEIEPDKVHTYTFSFTYKDTGTDQSVDMGKELSAKIQIFGENGKGVIIPFETNTLAFNIINNASTELNGTTLDLEQVTLPKVANEVSAYEYVKPEITTFSDTLSTASNYYIAYACDYTISADGKFTLGTEECPVTIMEEKYVYSEELANNLAGKYFVWSSSVKTPSTETSYSSISNLSSLYKITTETSKIKTSIAYEGLKRYMYKSSEDVLSTDYDDYGLSYYYRGGVKDNYVNFADMCWRIVRIEGDGSVKLILEDRDQLCNSKDNSGKLNIDGNWKIPTSTGGTVFEGNFGYKKNPSNSIPVFDYLNADGTAENYNYSMGTAFKNFQSTFTNEELLKLKSGDWCYNIDKIYLRSGDYGAYTYTLLTNQERQSYYDNYTQIWYDSYVRLQGLNEKQPTLKCNGTIMDSWGDNITPMYVSTLTLDEVTYAGANTGNYRSGTGDANYHFYLANNYSNGEGEYWWTLSPSAFMFISTQDYLYCVQPSGSINVNCHVANDAISFRPSISLASNAIITSGDGTQEKPYEIKIN